MLLKVVDTTFHKFQYKFQYSYLFFILLLIICPSFSSSKQNILHLERNASKSKIEKYYGTLISRMYAKDYGFAHFGEPCDVASITELEDYLGLAKKILKDQTPNGKYHPGLRVEDHLRLKLRSFYLQSRSICDFHKFLTCDKTSRKCSCSNTHTSMEVDLKDVWGCSIKIGKRCAFTDLQLNQMGIPNMPKEHLLISCFGQDSECVSSFGAANKICRCKNGFTMSLGGLGCRPTSWEKEMTVKSNNHGRSMGRAMSKLNDTKAEPEYFLLPDEIKLELVRFMNQRKIEEMQPGEHVKEATALYSKIESDNDREEMVIRDIFIRKLASLKFGEYCDPAKQKILDNPPVTMEGPFWADPKPETIKDWQLSLLLDKQPFCNFVDALVCHPTKKMCQCGDGMIFENNECHLSLQTMCGLDYQGKFQFNPLNELKRLSSPPSPSCVTGSTCESKPMLSKTQCWCPEGKVCVGSENGESNQQVITSLETLQSDIQSRLSLHLGDDCDAKSHVILLNPTEKQNNDYKLRITALEKLLGHTPPVQFCNLDKFLNCSSVTKKCECFIPLAEDDGECRARNRESCLETYSHGIDFYPGLNGIKMWVIERIFRKQFQPQCIHTADCELTRRKCACNNGNDGDLCDTEKSLVSPILKIGNVAGYDTDRDINEAFFKINFHTLQLEKIMKLKYNGKCDVEAGLMLERIIKFFNSIGHSDSNIAGGKTLHQYQKAGKWVDYLIQTGIKELCNGFQGLYCHHTEKCQCHEGFTYENGSCKINPNFHCDPHPLANWISTCRNNSVCIPSVINFRHTCQCAQGWSGESCEKNDELSQLECDGTEEECKQLILTGNTNSKDKLNLEDGLEELKKILEDIKHNRSSPEGSKCNRDREKEFIILFPTFPNYDLRNPTHLPKGVEHSREILLKMYDPPQNDTNFKPHSTICDKSLHLSCTKNETCTCDKICRDKQQRDLCKRAKANDKNMRPKDIKLILAICNMVDWSNSLDHIV